MNASAIEPCPVRTRIGLLCVTVAAFHCADLAIAATPPPPAPTPGPSSLEELQKQVDLEKQRNALLADLLANQKALIDAQKGAIDSQAALAASQKTLLDNTYPLITGGKTGTVTFDTANIGPLAQPGAMEALTTVADSICKSVRTKASSGVVLVNEADLKLIAQARWVSVQLVGLSDRYTAANPGAGVPVPVIAGSPLSGGSAGLALYGVGAALKEIASFTQLFRSDTAIYQATVKVDQETLTDAVAQCLLRVEPATANALDVFLPRSLLVASISAPSSSEIQEKLRLLTELRSKGDAELGSLVGKTDDASKRRTALLGALNTSMDALVATLFTVSEKTAEPIFIGALAGEALLGKVTGGVPLLQINLSNAAASGIKRSSIWRSDRLYSWSTITVNYALFDQTGKLLAAGTVSNSPEPRKVVVEP